jgi:hypothetical protein
LNIITGSKGGRHPWRDWSIPTRLKIGPKNLEIDDLRDASKLIAKIA